DETDQRKANRLTNALDAELNWLKAIRANVDYASTLVTKLNQTREDAATMLETTSLTNSDFHTQELLRKLEGSISIGQSATWRIQPKMAVRLRANFLYHSNQADQETNTLLGNTSTLNERLSYEIGTRVLETPVNLQWEWRMTQKF